MSDSKYRMIRLPAELANELDDIAESMLEAYERGRGFNDIPLSENRGKEFFSKAAVIRRALNELRDKRARSGHKASQKTS